MFIANKPSILIIDDDTAILNTFARIFQRKGFCVAVAEKGQDAMEKISSNHFDVALIDLCVSDMEGTKLCPLIRRTSPKTVKIILTEKTLAQNNIEGADVLLGKPIAIDDLLRVIDSKLKNRNIEISVQSEFILEKY